MQRLVVVKKSRIDIVDLSTGLLYVAAQNRRTHLLPRFVLRVICLYESLTFNIYDVNAPILTVRPVH